MNKNRWGTQRFIFDNKYIVNIMQTINRYDGEKPQFFCIKSKENIDLRILSIV